MLDHEALLTRIDSYLNSVPAAACDVERIGPFLVFFRRATAMPELSYARPANVKSLVRDSDVSAVRAAFTDRSRQCRWEFIQDLVPDLPLILERNGFPTCIPRPLMVVTQDTFRPESSREAVVRSIAISEAPALDRVLRVAFGESEYELSDQEDNSMLASMIDRGGVAVAALVGGAPVAGGLHMPQNEVTEVAGVGTLPQFRNRGFAGAVSSALVADAFTRGCECVFLSAADEIVQRVYARIGFKLVGTAMDTMDTRTVPGESSLPES